MSEGEEVIVETLKEILETLGNLDAHVIEMNKTLKKIASNTEN